MDRRVAICVALLAFVVVLVIGESATAAVRTGRPAPPTRLAAVPNGTSASDPPSPGASAAPTTPAPTTTPTPTATDDPAGPGACDNAIYTDGEGGGAIAITPGAAIEGGVVIHNRSPFSTAGGSLSVAVVTDGERLTSDAAPTVEWDVDGGPWQHVDETFVPAANSVPAYWNSADMPAPTISAHGSRLFRMRIAFPQSTVTGYYDGTFIFTIPDCKGTIYDLNQVLFSYNPGLAAPGSHTGSNTATRQRGQAQVAKAPSAPPSGRAPAPSASVGPTPVATAQAAAATATRPVSRHGSAWRYDAGIGAAGLCGLLALLQIVRWQRVRSASRPAPSTKSPAP